MIFARLAVIAAVLCSLWFNGSYAYAKAHSPSQQLAMVAVALSIDLCKCAFLPAASVLWAEGRRLAPTVLVLLWPLAFSYSLFAGYASVATNRSDASTLTETQAQARLRAQGTYDQVTADLTTAKQTSLWTATAACTAAKTNAQRTFCANIDELLGQQRAAAISLDASRVVKTDPELSLLASVTTLPLPTLAIAIAFAPALILELVSSLGLYATRRPRASKAPRTRAGWFFSRRTETSRPSHENPPEGRLQPVPPKAQKPAPANDVWEWELPTELP